jgi:hypothetical protein
VNDIPGWYKTSQCLWSSTTESSGKVTLNEHYEELKTFFVETLGVSTLTLQIVYDELLQMGSGQPSLFDVKHNLQALNSLLQTDLNHPDAAPFLKCKLFPVKYPDGTTSLTSADVEFAIIDRQHLADRFQPHVKVLDYTLEEVRCLKPFLEWANLHNRYLSASVKEITCLSGDMRRAISLPSRDMGRKAHALLR